MQGGRAFRNELVRVLHYEVQEHFKRITGSGIRCYVAEDLSAVTGEFNGESGTTYRFSIPVVVTEEHSPNVSMAAGRPMEPQAHERRCTE